MALGALLAASFCKSWRVFVFFQGALFPIGVGILYWAPIICAWEWFPDRKGMVCGLIAGGFGFGAFIYGFISTAIVNPDDVDKVANDQGIKYYPEEVANRVPKMYRECLYSWLVLAICGVALVSRNPEYVKQE